MSKLARLIACRQPSFHCPQWGGELKHSTQWGHGSRTADSCLSGQQEFPCCQGNSGLTGSGSGTVVGTVIPATVAAVDVAQLLPAPSLDDSLTEADPPMDTLQGPLSMNCLLCMIDA